jgi:hypothetical protein
MVKNFQHMQWFFSFSTRETLFVLQWRNRNRGALAASTMESSPPGRALWRTLMKSTPWKDEREKA